MVRFHYVVVLARKVMKNNSTYIVYLLRKKRQGSLNLTENNDFQNWLDEKPAHKDLLREIATNDRSNEVLGKMVQYDQVQSLADFKEKFRKPKKVYFFGSAKWVAAAAILLFLGVGITYFVTQLNKAIQDDLFSDQSRIIPAQDQAILEFNNGKRIDLTSIEKNSSIEFENLLLTRTHDGEIVFSAHNKVYDEVINVQVKTPRGGYSQIRLSDGTAVHLGPSSVLEFPAVFAATKERQIKLEGEGYFEVTKHLDANKNNIPFRIRVGHQHIEVLGTSFEVNAYPNEEYMKTTLVEGKVRIQTEEGITNLNPGQRAVVHKKENSVAVHNLQSQIDNNHFSESFYFEGESIEEIMTRIGRWYNVDIVYKGEVSKELLTGVASKHQSPEEVLRLLGLIGNFKFKIDGRRIIVMN